MPQTITYLNDPLEIQELTKKWVGQLEKDNSNFTISSRTKILLSAFYQESSFIKITALHTKFAKLYAIIHHGLKKRCDICEVNEVAFYSLRANCYCELCVEWLKLNLEKFPFKAISSIREEVGRTVFGEHVLAWLELDLDKLIYEIPTVSKNATSELQLISNKVKLLLEDLKRQQTRFIGAYS